MHTSPAVILLKISPPRWLASSAGKNCYNTTFNEKGFLLASQEPYMQGGLLGQQNPNVSVSNLVPGTLQGMAKHLWNGHPQDYAQFSVCSSLQLETGKNKRCVWGDGDRLGPGPLWSSLSLGDPYTSVSLHMMRVQQESRQWEGP